ncbi:OmpA/MotB family protein [Chitinivibrio alkaliphilus]|uniref:Flagellar motor protein MotB n=1 Tax=Chitinivibrio alkaliphilus ACht1 TaxID=1313304 RepID=U7DAB6_9BACT|nr:flagellar motor protein MotB [Chitinivibrio alkaliphilus]ERP32077.1 flagellar motor protein MotB [Chitinivibrio alkaliphilus ACht1]
MADQEECKQEECKQGSPEYMATYGDMMTLLLCFFVLLLSMAEVDPAKFDIAASSFQNALSGVLESLPTVAVQQEVLRPRLGGDDQNKRIAANAAMRIREVTQQDEFLEDAVRVKVTEKGIGVIINDPVTFDPGSAELKNEFMTILETVMTTIEDIPQKAIRVEGHTDNVPISTPQYPSNWELSSARALSVVQYLYGRGIDPAKLSAVGYGEYRPLVPNTSAENRQKNRRIEIYVDFTD